MINLNYNYAMYSSYNSLTALIALELNENSVSILNSQVANNILQCSVRVLNLLASYITIKYVCSYI